LLGRLDEELSCANSRFFRTTLYSDPNVADYLRAHYVLHWESVRPVPKVTIDFGDGRSLQTTLTGNSIHYVLDENGALVDALPGLYGAQRFRAELERAAVAAADLSHLSPGDGRDLALAKYHSTRFGETAAAWRSEMEQLGRSDPLPALPTVVPSGRTAVELAATKGVVERPVLVAASFSDRVNSLEAVLDNPVWPVAAHRHLGENALSPAAREAVRRKYVARTPASSADEKLFTNLESVCGAGHNAQ
jgi:hypothetical protein